MEKENYSGITQLLGVITIICSASVLLVWFLLFVLFFIFGYFGDGPIDFWTGTFARISSGVFYLSNIPLLFAGIKILKTKNRSSALAFTASIFILLSSIVFLRSYFIMSGYKNSLDDYWEIFLPFVSGVYSAIYILHCCFTCRKELLNELIPSSSKRK